MTTDQPYGKWPLSVLAAAAFLAACGGGGGADSTTAASDTPAATASDDDTYGPRIDGEAQGDNVAAAVPATLEDRDREDPQAVAGAVCSAAAFARPRTVAYDMTRDRSAERQALLARFGLAIVNSNLADGPAALKTFTEGIKTLNPGTRVAQYVSFPDVKKAGARGDYDEALAKAVTARSWWLTDGKGTQANGAGADALGVNVTGWATPDANGDRFPQFKAKFDFQAYLEGATGIDYVFSANVLPMPRVDADWKGNGSVSSKSDPTVQSALRAGYVSYWNTLRALSPEIQIMGALDKSSDLSSPEYQGTLDAAYLDGLTGAAWSMESRQGWSSMMKYYAGALSAVKQDGLVVFSSVGKSPTDYAAMRYGLASALLYDGHFVFRSTSGSAVPVWYDEYAAPLGNASEGAPTAAAENGVWKRTYENGLVLVNPGDAPATINVGAGYRRLNGAQDPSVNTGQAESVVTLPARSGLLLVRADPCADDGAADGANAGEGIDYGDGRESAQAVTVSSSARGFATPKVAGLDYSRNTTTSRREMLSKFDFLIISTTKSMGASAMRSFTDDIKRRNPKIEMSHYVLPTEVLCSVRSGHDHYDTWQATERADWWLYRANGSHSQWSTAYKACDINFTKWGRKDSSGKTWAQWKWNRDYNVFFKNMPAVGYVHFDNVMRAPRVDADWKRNRTNQSRNNAEIQREFRLGMANNWKAVRSANSKYKISGNADSDLSFSEYKGQLDFAFLEGVIGKSWSKERNWDVAMDYYRGSLKNTKTANKVIFQAFTCSTCYAVTRYGLAMAMLEDGYFMQTNYPSSKQEPSWFDEFDAPIGKPIESPPRKATKDTVWTRKYENGMVLVNASKSKSVTINVGSGYRRLKGTQDRSVNSGASVSSVTLKPRSGLLLVKKQ